MQSDNDSSTRRVKHLIDALDDDPHTNPPGLRMEWEDGDRSCTVWLCLTGRRADVIATTTHLQHGPANGTTFSQSFSQNRINSISMSNGSTMEMKIGIGADELIEMASRMMDALAQIRDASVDKA